jgi:queuine/archaeosine tRNA-ribosyltransferase
VSWTLQVMQRMRDSIAAGSFQELRAQVLDVWG